MVFGPFLCIALHVLGVRDFFFTFIAIPFAFSFPFGGNRIYFLICVLLCICLTTLNTLVGLQSRLYWA